MAIDINTLVEAGFFLRWMTVKRLREILEQLDDNNIVIPNRVGNLAVTNDKDQMVGYIDFPGESFEEKEFGHERDHD